jgi:hypothetical protein
MIGIFVLGYVGIIFEQVFDFNKAAGRLWIMYAEFSTATPPDSRASRSAQGTARGGLRHPPRRVGDCRGRGRAPALRGGDESHHYQGEAGAVLGHRALHLLPVGDTEQPHRDHSHGVAIAQADTERRGQEARRGHGRGGRERRGCVDAHRARDHDDAVDKQPAVDGAQRDAALPRVSIAVITR